MRQTPYAIRHLVLCVAPSISGVQVSTSLRSSALTVQQVQQLESELELEHPTDCLYMTSQLLAFSSFIVVIIVPPSTSINIQSCFMEIHQNTILSVFETRSLAQPTEEEITIIRH